jgi:hypothetical protein
MTWSLGNLNRKQTLKRVSWQFAVVMSPAICVTTRHAYGKMTQSHQSPPST